MDYTYRGSGNPKLVGLVFLAIGLLMAGFGGYMLYNNMATPWATVEGTVLESALTEHQSTSGRSGTSYTWGFMAKYEFEFNGKKWADAYDSISSSDYSMAQRFVDEHPPGSKVQVKVNPADPYDTRVSVDFWQENVMWVVLLAMGVVFTLIGLAVVTGNPLPPQPGSSGPQGEIRLG